jgi:hypothetical protein
MSTEEIINKHFDYLNNEFEVIRNILENKEAEVNTIGVINTDELLAEK